MTLQQKLISELLPPYSSGNRYIDMSLLVAVLMLLSVGLVLVSSASMEVAGNLYGNPFYILFKQIVFVVGGLFCMALMIMVPIQKVEQYNWVLLALALFLLFIVLFIGREVNGSTRWIPLGVFNLQASEAAKLMIVVYMAGFVSRRLDEIRTTYRGFFKPFLILAISSILILLEPDLGSVVVLTAAVLGMIFLAGAKLIPFLGLVVIVSVGIFALAYFEPYRWLRMTSFIDPWADAYGSGYQLTQSLIAFGRGEWFGLGLGNSVQKLFYLPEAHTDFIFAVLAEEFGFAGAACVLLLVLFISVRAMKIGSMADRKGMLFHAYLAYGIGFLYAFQAFVNIAVNTGLAPTKGLAFPMISYGGSSLLINALAFGLLLRIDYERRRLRVEQRPSNGERSVKSG